MRALTRFIAITAMVMLAAVGVANAGPGGGGGHGGGGGGGGHAAGGFHGGGGGFHGGYGGWRAGPGWHGGWRGGYYGRYGWCCGGWGWGWGLGFYLPLLPWYYDTYWWNGIPYYYADGNYYLWDGDLGAYEAVEPPAGLSSTPPPGSSSAPSRPAVSTELFAYPKAGQSQEQQRKDKDECRRWAAAETGFNAKPAAAGQGAAVQNAVGQEDYLRAEAACLEARNYSVK
jgi:hypothetical protein